MFICMDINDWLCQFRYNIHPTQGFEPYVILNRLTMPKFDERFDRRFYNKIEHIFELRMFRYRFIAIPDLFVIHINHPTNGSAYGRTKFEMRKLYGSFRIEMQQIDDIEERRFDSFRENCGI